MDITDIRVIMVITFYAHPKKVILPAHIVLNFPSLFKKHFCPELEPPPPEDKVMGVRDDIFCDPLIQEIVPNRF
jgi:hypothetical protein